MVRKILVFLANITVELKKAHKFPINKAFIKIEQRLSTEKTNFILMF